MSTNMDVSGKAQTVLGPVSPDDLGRTMPHEHLSMNYYKAFRQPMAGDEHMIDKPLTLENIYWVNRHPYASKANLTLYGAEEVIIDEVKDFKLNGGGTVVENSIHGLERDMNYLVQVARTTGVNIIAGTGYYFDAFHGTSVRNCSEEKLAEQIRTDLVDGWQGTEAKCGVIGEVGCSYPLTDFERKSLQASATVQSELGAPVIIHPGRDAASPSEILRILQEAGGDTSRTVMSHLDRTMDKDEELLDLAKTGCIIEFDFFGMEHSHYMPVQTVNLPNDGERLRRIKILVDEGFHDNVVIAHDIHTKHRLMKYGGHGLSHILKYIVPKMLASGFSQEVVDQILIHTPKRWLTFK